MFHMIVDVLHYLHNRDKMHLEIAHLTRQAESSYQRSIDSAQGVSTAAANLKSNADFIAALLRGENNGHAS